MSGQNGRKKQWAHNRSQCSYTLSRNVAEPDDIQKMSKANVHNIIKVTKKNTATTLWIFIIISLTTGSWSRWSSWSNWIVGALLKFLLWSQIKLNIHFHSLALALAFALAFALDLAIVWVFINIIIGIIWYGNTTTTFLIILIRRSNTYLQSIHQTFIYFITLVVKLDRN